MESKRVWRYYCEYCKKSGCGKYAMQQHEIYCTMNPNRKCRMCEIAETKQTDIEILKKALPVPKESSDDYCGISYVVGEKEPLKAIKEITYCPACILAAIRQSGWVSYMYQFDYKAECKSFWDDVNEDKADKYDMNY